MMNYNLPKGVLCYPSLIPTELVTPMKLACDLQDIIEKRKELLRLRTMKFFIVDENNERIMAK